MAEIWKQLWNGHGIIRKASMIAAIITATLGVGTVCAASIRWVWTQQDDVSQMTAVKNNIRFLTSADSSMECRLQTMEEHERLWQYRDSAILYGIGQIKFALGIKEFDPIGKKRPHN